LQASLIDHLGVPRRSSGPKLARAIECRLGAIDARQPPLENCVLRAERPGGGLKFGATAPFIPQCVEGFDASPWSC